MTDFTRPFDDTDAEALAHVLAAWNGTLPDALDVVRRDIVANERSRDQAIAAMRRWRDA